MSAGIALLRHSLVSHDEGHITRLPRYVAPNDGGKYWHVPRAAAHRGNGLARVEFWCGMWRTVRLDTMTNERPTELLCATCDGRASGYESREGLVFRPRSPFDMPRHCPAFGGDPHATHCAWCGGKRKWRRSYVHYTEAPHAPGDGLAEFTPCPRHGWRKVALITDPIEGERLECLEWIGGFTTKDGRCHHALSRPPLPTGGETR